MEKVTSVCDVPVGDCRHDVAVTLLTYCVLVQSAKLKQEPENFSNSESEWRVSPTLIWSATKVG